jgi:hypothetical protein
MTIIEQLYAIVKTLPQEQASEILTLEVSSKSQFRIELGESNTMLEEKFVGDKC